MKILSYLSLIILFLSPIFSCSKNDDHPKSTQPPIYMKFKLDGVLQDCTGSFDSLLLKGKGVTARKEGLPFDPGKVYDLTGQANRNTEFSFRLYSDSLQVKEYIFNTELGYTYVELVVKDPYVYKRYFPYRAKGDSIVLKISRYSDKTIDGTFSGRLSSFDQAYTYKTVFITEGEFKNVPIFFIR